MTPNTPRKGVTPPPKPWAHPPGGRCARAAPAASPQRAAAGWLRCRLSLHARCPTCCSMPRAKAPTSWPNAISAWPKTARVHRATCNFLKESAGTLPQHNSRGHQHALHPITLKAIIPCIATVKVRAPCRDHRESGKANGRLAALLRGGLWLRLDENSDANMPACTHTALQHTLKTLPRLENFIPVP